MSQAASSSNTVARLTRRVSGRLGVQLVSSIVATALLAGVGVAALTINQARDTLRDQILNTNLAAADIAAAHAANYVTDIQASVLSLAARRDIQFAVERGDFVRLNDQLERWLAINTHAANVAFWDLDDIRRADGSSDKSQVGLTCLPDCTWHASVVSSGAPAFGAPLISKSTGSPIVPYALPMRDTHGEVRGLLSAGVSLTGLSQTLTSMHVAPGSRTSLDDLSQRTILAHVDPTRILMPASGKNEAANRMFEGRRGVMESHDSGGEQMLSSFTPVSGMPWGVLIQEPSSEAFAPVDQMVTRAIELVGVALLVALLAGLALAIRIVRPLRRLRHTASAMAAGELGERTGIDRHDEIGDLGRAFDSMAERLQDTVVKLQRTLGHLVDSEQRKTAMLAVAPDAIISMDDQGRISEFNPAAEELFGYKQDEVIGRILADVIVPERLRDSHSRGLVRAREGKRALAGQRVELVALRRDGTEFPVEVAIADFRLGDQVAYTGFLRDITERKRAEEALEHQALHDALTGLPNRVLLRDRLEHAIASAERGGCPSLLVMDLDRFKEVNDTMGHHAGDMLLKDVAERFRSALRASDTVARLGGDEFAILARATAESASSLAEKLLSALDEPFTVEGHSVAVGASVGIACYPDHGDDVDSLIRHADVAMYAAKRSRSGYVVYAPEQDHHTLDRLALVAELRQALTRDDEFVLYYQPKVDLLSGQVAGTEALIRWQHPRRGLLGPDQFIELAEHTGMMRPLTQWVVRTALRQVRQWHASGLRLPVAVNLSPSSLQDPNLAHEFAELLAAAGVDAQWLEVEISEEAYMTQPERVVNTLARLRMMGVRVSIDDFGTGYSSLMYLQKLPVDALKIDRTFVRTMATDASHETIVRSIIDLGHNLGLEIIAEGIEDDETRRRLEDLGCEQGQGNGLRRPQPARELTEWLCDHVANTHLNAA